MLVGAAKELAQGHARRDRILRNRSSWPDRGGGEAKGWQAAEPEACVAPACVAPAAPKLGRIRWLRLGQAPCSPIAPLLATWHQARAPA